MRPWSSLGGLLLSLAAHAALVLVLATVWVGEAPPLPALTVDLAALETPAGSAGGDIANATAARSGSAATAGEVSRPPARGPGTRRDGVVPAPDPLPDSAPPPAPPAAAPASPVPSAGPARPPVPPLAAPPAPVGILAVPPEPLPSTPHSPDAVPALPRPDTPDPPRHTAVSPPLPAPLPPAAVLDVPRPGPTTPGSAPRPAAGSSKGVAAPAPRPAPDRTRAGVGGDPGGAPRGAGDATPGEPRGSGRGSVGSGDGVPRGDAGAGGSGSGSDASGVAGGPLALVLPDTGAGDAAATEYRAYYDGIRRLVRDALRYPPAARRQGLSGTVELELQVRPSGTVGSVAVVRSSSHRVLDDAALEAVRGLPRMPFPPGVQPRALRVRIPVDFELR